MNERDQKVDQQGIPGSGQRVPNGCAGDDEVGVSNPSNDGNIWTEWEDLKGHVKSSGAASLSDWDF